MSEPVVIGMVAGEASGDNLGAPIVSEILARQPDARLVGVGGPAMIDAGFESLVDMDRLSVNGIIDPLKRLPELIRILMMLRRAFREQHIDCFVGVDYNFFNGLLEKMLKADGVTTVHYVSPTIWAWRSGRIRKIQRDIDLMLTLYPFETAIYQEHNVQVRFVGHPKAHQIEPDRGDADRDRSRLELGVRNTSPIVAILPGSRSGEVALSGPDFIRAASLLFRNRPCQFLVPAANDRRREQIESLWQSLAADVPVTISTGNAIDVMTAADAVLVNSGTATLEAMLLRRPMVMSYRLGKWTYAIVSRMVRTPYFALPNILTGRPLVPEFIQDEATPEALADALETALSEPQDEVLAAFAEVHDSLRLDSGTLCAEAILQLVETSTRVSD